MSFACFGEALEIEKLAQTQTPQGNQNLMKDNATDLWHGLEPGTVAHQDAEVVVVQEVQHLLGLLDAGIPKFPGSLLGETLAFFHGQLIVLVDIARADDQNVAVFEFNFLRLCTFNDVLD